jgi:hypothetical protein
MWKYINFQIRFKKLYVKGLKVFSKYEKRLLLVVGFILISLISFIFGLAKNSDFVQQPIVVHSPIASPILIKEVCANEKNTAQDCNFVGSIKGKKYYPPSCSFAKKISKENLRCFKSDEDAQNKGYTRSKSCK